MVPGALLQCGAAVAFAALVAVAAPVSAQRAHEADFYARLAIGPGHAESSANSIESGQQVELSGEGIDYAIAIGGITIPNLAVHVNLWGWSTFSPIPKYEHSALNLGTSLSLVAYGAGVTYIFMPINLYVSVAPGFAVLRTSGPDIESSTSDRGFAWEGSIGKEWWFSETTAWGVAVGGGWHSARSPDITDRKWTGWNASLRLSITTN
jgi:hypothetical protein